MKVIKLSLRQEKIIELVRKYEPITSKKLASKLNVTRAALRPDLTILTMLSMLEAKPKVGYICSKKPSHSPLYDSIINIKVKDVMSKPVIISEETSVYNSILNLFLNDVGTLFVENDGCLVGAVSRKDFLKASIGGTDIRNVPIGVIMTRMPNIVFVNGDETVCESAKKIIEHEVDSLPVVEKVLKDNEERYKIVGKISKTNLTKLLVKMVEML